MPQYLGYIAENVEGKIKTNLQIVEAEDSDAAFLKVRSLNHHAIRNRQRRSAKFSIQIATFEVVKTVDTRDIYKGK